VADLVQRRLGIDDGCLRRDVPRLGRGLLHEKGSVDHVHAAREPELATLVRHELDGGAFEGGKRRGDAEVGEQNAGGAVAGLLAVEDKPQRHTALGADDIGRVAASDRDLHLLHAAP
jgi:hypothetical protein